MAPTPEKWLLWCLLATNFTSILLAAVAVAVSWRVASRFSRVLKRRPPSESTLQRLSVDQAALASSLESLATTVKRMSSRRGMQEHRSDRAATDGPGVLSKQELKRRLLGGKTQAEIVSLARGS